MYEAAVAGTIAVFRRARYRLTDALERRQALAAARFLDWVVALCTGVGPMGAARRLKELSSLLRWASFQDPNFSRVGRHVRDLLEALPRGEPWFEACLRLSALGRALPEGGDREVASAMEDHYQRLTSAFEVEERLLERARTFSRSLALGWKRDGWDTSLPPLAACLDERPNSKALRGLPLGLSGSACSSFSRAQGGSTMALSVALFECARTKQPATKILPLQICLGYLVHPGPHLLTAAVSADEHLCSWLEMKFWQDQVATEKALGRLQQVKAMAAKMGHALSEDELRLAVQMPRPYRAWTSGTVLAVRERGVKARIVSKGCAELIALGQRLRAMLFRGLRLAPELRYTLLGEPDVGLERLCRPFWKGSAPAWSNPFSADLTAATDLIPHSLARALMDPVLEVAGVSPVYRAVASTLLGPQELSWPQLGRKATTVRGILMGLPLSWTVLSLYQFWLLAEVRLSLRKRLPDDPEPLVPTTWELPGPTPSDNVDLRGAVPQPARPGDERVPALLCGDDLIAVTPPRGAALYLSLVQQTGGQPSKGKGFYGPRGGIFVEIPFRWCRGVDRSWVPGRLRRRLGLRPCPPQAVGFPELIPYLSLRGLVGRSAMGGPWDTMMVPWWHALLSAAQSPWFPRALEPGAVGLRHLEQGLLARRVVEALHPELLARLRKLHIPLYLPHQLGGAGLIPLDPVTGGPSLDRPMVARRVARRAASAAVLDLSGLNRDALGRVWSVSALGTSTYFSDALRHAEERVQALPRLRAATEERAGHLMTASYLTDRLAVLLARGLSLVGKPASRRSRREAMSLSGFARRAARVVGRLASLRTPEITSQSLRQVLMRLRTSSYGDLVDPQEARISDVTDSWEFALDFPGSQPTQGLVGADSTASTR